MSSRIRSMISLAMLCAIPAVHAQTVGFGNSGIIIIDNTQFAATGTSLSIHPLQHGRTGVSGSFANEIAVAVDPTQREPVGGPEGHRTLGVDLLDPYHDSALDVVTVPNSSQGTIALVAYAGLPSEHVYLRGNTSELRSVLDYTGMSYVPEFASHVADLSNLTLDAGFSSFFAAVVDDVGLTPTASFRLFVCVATGQWAVAYDATRANFASLHANSLDGYIQGTVRPRTYERIESLIEMAEMSYYAGNPAKGGPAAATYLVQLQADIAIFLSDGEITDGQLADRLDGDAERILAALDTNGHYAVSLILGGTL